MLTQPLLCQCQRQGNAILIHLSRKDLEGFIRFATGRFAKPSRSLFYTSRTTLLGNLSSFTLNDCFNPKYAV